MRTLVLGGARSGKSGHAEELVASHVGVRYVATARRTPGDHDWDRRIAEHRLRRPAHWETLEDVELVELLDRVPPGGVATLVDDLGTWLTGILDDHVAWDSPRGVIAPARDALVRAVAGYEGDLVLVSPEVGMGVIPEHRSGRLFRDEIGRLNADLASVCDAVVLVVAGLAVPLRTPGRE